MKSVVFATAFVALSVPALAAKPADKGAIIIRSVSCQALDTTGTLFTDPTAREQVVVTPSGNINLDCAGNLPASAVLPPAPVSFDQSSGLPNPCPTDTTIFPRWEEAINPDGIFDLTCHFNPHKT